MPFLFIIFLLILLPAMEVYLLFNWIGDAPVIALLYLILSILAGMFCIRLAKAGAGELLPRMRQMRGKQEVRKMLLLGKLWFAGVLLLFPGYLTDIIALCLFLFTAGKKQTDDKIVTARGHIVDDD